MCLTESTVWLVLVALVLSSPSCRLTYLLPSLRKDLAAKTGSFFPFLLLISCGAVSVGKQALTRWEEPMKTVAGGRSAWCKWKGGITYRRRTAAASRSENNASSPAVSGASSSLFLVSAKACACLAPRFLVPGLLVVLCLGCCLSCFVVFFHGWLIPSLQGDWGFCISWHSYYSYMRAS